MILTLPFNLFPENEKAYPKINTLNHSDIIFRQLQEDISFYYKAKNSGKELPPLLFYSYKSNENLNIFSIASRIGIPYDTIASLNRLDNANESLNGKTLIIPSQAGIFFSKKPKTDIEFIAHSWRTTSLKSAKKVDLAGECFYFFPSETYHIIERAYFLNILFNNPLPSGVVSSGYGLRESPFTGEKSFHNGIDIAAPEGTVVYSARDGEVVAKGKNKVFGNYIEIKHAGGYSTFYGHLKKTFIKLHDKVNSSMIIAEVGSTGLSTGPHLHFEVRQNGENIDPSRLLPGLNK